MIDECCQSRDEERQFEAAGCPQPNYCFQHTAKVVNVASAKRGKALCTGSLSFFDRSAAS